MKNLKQHQNKWFEENAPFGRELGYPECCIKEFCDQPPVFLKYHTPTADDKIRFKASLIDGIYTGFIPCVKHAKQIVSKQITLQSLIQNRNPLFPEFPNYK